VEDFVASAINASLDSPWTGKTRYVIDLSCTRDTATRVDNVSASGQLCLRLEGFSSFLCQEQGGRGSRTRDVRRRLHSEIRNTGMRMELALKRICMRAVFDALASHCAIVNMRLCDVTSSR
jgi:hypothetical protein